jgi:(heptosyl)LPS beta-1,4-glucosyltransferase
MSERVDRPEIIAEVPPADRERVSACLIVQDEQDNIFGALDSVSFCDQIIVVDGGSSDRTVEIARELGATVIENRWPGFAAQRNVALDAADGEWVLELDADERVTPPLRASIEALLASPPDGVAMAVCPLRHRFLGRLLGPSAKYPAYRSRIFKREAYRHDESRSVHEGLEPRERPATLEGDLEHALAASLGEALRDAWRYARLESAHLARPANPVTYLRGIVLRPGAKIVYRTLVDEGWRDGWQGMLKIMLDASSDALVWARVMLGSAGVSDATVSGSGADVTGYGKRVDADGGIQASGAQTVASTDRSDGGRHFGRRPAGAPKVVALAAGSAATRDAGRWLVELQANGIDVALISTDDAEEELPTRRVGSLAPLATMRALDVEMQLRTIHAVVPFGHRARVIRHLLPGTLRPRIPGVDAATEPAVAARRAGTSG